MEQLEIDRSAGTAASTVILRLKGPLTLATLFPLQDLLRELKGVDLIIDVSQVPYMDSAGLGTLLSSWAHSQRDHRKFALTGVSPRVAVLLEITKVNTVLPMCETAEIADAQIAASAASA
jgi:anti-sigma B factor antagonist